MIGTLKAALIVPFVIGCLWVMSAGSDAVGVVIPRQGVDFVKAPSGVKTTQAMMVSRRERIERLLTNLEVVAGIAQQMAPERAAQIEMVLDEMVGQCVELANERALRDRATDAKLLSLEKSLSRLVNTFDRILEPELSL